MKINAFVAISVFFLTLNFYYILSMSIDTNLNCFFVLSRIQVNDDSNFLDPFLKNKILHFCG